MKKMSSVVSIGLILILAAGSCSTPENHSTIEYFITADESIDIESLNLTFDYTRAYQESDDAGNEAIRTVYLDSQELWLTADGLQEPIFLGSSEIESGKVHGFNFSFSSVSIVKNANTLEAVSKSYDESNKVENSFSLTPGETKKITFVIRTDESLSTLSNGDTKFWARIHY